MLRALAQLSPQAFLPPSSVNARGYLRGRAKVIPPSGPATLLRILATSDVHMHLRSHDYFANAPLPGRGLEAIAGPIAHLRADADAQGGQVLLFDNGDLLQGTPLADHLTASVTDKTPHPVAQVLGDLGYDAMGLGNHDVDYGLPYLAKFARDLPCPVISSNLHLTEPADWLAPSVLLRCGPWTVGVLSVLPERTAIWAHTHLNRHATISDMAEACRKMAGDLKARGADLVVALAHTGIGRCPEENALATIASEGSVDALIGGHTHNLFPAPDPVAGDAVDLERGALHSVPTVMPGFAAEALGCIDLYVTRTADGTACIEEGTARLIHAQTAPRTAPSSLRAIDTAHAEVRTTLNEVIGTSDVPLNSYMASVQPTRLLALAAAAQRGAVAKAARGSPFADLPVISAIAPARAGGAAGPMNYADIPAGPLRRGQIAEMHVFPNAIWGVPITGAELRLWLEKAAVAFARPEDRPTFGLLCPTVPAFDFDMMFGVTYEINPLMPARYNRNGQTINSDAKRIENLRFNGAPIKDTDRFLVASSSYRACGGGQFPMLTPAREMLRADLPASRVMQDYVASGATPDAPPPWQFAEAARGTKTWFDTGPGALAHLEDIAHLSPRAAAETDAGFMRIEITL